MQSSVEKIIHSGSVEHYFQPIWRIAHWKVYGYEGLLRFGSGNRINPEELFDEARSEGLLYEFDTLSFVKAIEQFPFMDFDQQLLFLNVYPSTILHPDFIELLIRLIEKHPELPGRVVLEMNETIEEEYAWNDPDLPQKLDVIKKFGFLIALDDVGKGAATFQKMIDFKPTFVKLDRYFSEGLAYSKEKQETISMLSQYLDPQMTFILEGVEQDVDLAQAKMLNVPIVQGYLLGEPQKLETGLKEKIFII
ncbi:EAL domain-containing protein [Falsibacillus pallidus]|uniref:EAL domain-containing protein (Putative c-di-GMP-specific phosphodiesterase class I) n=1 Tax=Falsibacillus pallidus TaxID=493781 RepID=A0A370GDG9_9BACI|nr:EAL domain-containing protein [Falsibacillus pallidus]RDI40023.1 EAL domain-containing protein (putative c-di-GMP-specific phosphodiesterase class I) [Falsibacillus pallidus]